MANSGISTLFEGLDSIATMRARRDAAALTRKKMEIDEKRDTEDRELKTRQLKLKQLAGTRTEIERIKRATEAANTQADRVQQQMADETWRRDPNNPANQERAQRIALLKKQIAAAEAKPRTPMDAQLAGIKSLTERMTELAHENQAALAAAQAGDPDGQKRAMKAQVELGSLQQLHQNIVKQAKPDREPDVTIQLPGPKRDDGSESPKLTMRVPQSQWNPQHPLWGQFNPQTTAAPPRPANPATGDGIPVLTPQQAAAVAPGTRYRGTNGKLYIR